MTYVRRYSSLTGAVSYDLLPAASPLRPFLTGFGICGAIGAANMLGTSEWWQFSLSLALKGGAVAWLASASWEAYSNITIWKEMQALAKGVKPTPAGFAPVLLPAAPDATPPLNAARDMRHEVIRLLNQSIAVNGKDGKVIPRYDKLQGFSAEKRRNVLYSIAAHVDKSMRGTVVRDMTLGELAKAVEVGTVKPRVGT